MPCEKECAEKTDVTIEDMNEAIKANFSPLDHFEVDDLGTCGTSYKVIIVSVSMKSFKQNVLIILKSMFEGMKTLDKHKLVNEKLKTEIAILHAFSQKTFTPAQWEKKKNEQ